MDEVARKLDRWWSAVADLGEAGTLAAFNRQAGVVRQAWEELAGAVRLHLPGCHSHDPFRLAANVTGALATPAAPPPGGPPGPPAGPCTPA